MQIELKNIKHFAAGSEETECFTATIYVDGKKEGEAKNDGHGGMTFITPHQLEQAIADYAKTLPHKDLDMGDGEVVKVEVTADSLIDSLLSDYLIERDVKRAMKNKVLFTKKGKRGIYQSRPIANLAAEVAKGEEYIRSKFKSVEVVRVLNFMPLAEAVALYRDEPMEA